MPSTLAKQSAAGAPALTRGLDILKATAAAKDGLNFGEILSCVDAPRATVSRLIRVLREQQDLIKSEQDGRYRLGPSMDALTRVGDLNAKLDSIGRPLLKALRDETGHTCLLIRFELRENQPESLCLAKAIHPDSFAMQQEGNRSLDMGHGPWCWLWYLRAESGDQASMRKLMNKREEFVERWPDNKAFIEKYNFACDNNLLGVGLRRLAAPVFDSKGQLVASVGLGATQQSLPKSEVVNIGKKMLATAQAIEIKMGWEQEQS